MPSEFGARPDQNSLGPAADLDGVVRDEAMPAHDEIERTLALPDPAFADDEHPETQDVHEHSMRDHSLRKGVFENRRQLRKGRRRRGSRLEEWQAGAFSLDRQFRRWRKAARDEHAWEVEREGESQRLNPGSRHQMFEVPDFAFTEHQHAARTQVFLKSSKRQSGFLRMRIGDYPIDAVRAGEQFERQTERVGPAPEQATHGDAWSWGHLPFSPVPTWVGIACLCRSSGIAPDGTHRQCPGKLHRRSASMAADAPSNELSPSRAVSSALEGRVPLPCRSAYRDRS